MRIKGSAVVMGLYLTFLLVPIYWLLNMSLKRPTPKSPAASRSGPTT
jgi:hypothetical protein